MSSRFFMLRLCCIIIPALLKGILNALAVLGTMSAAYPTIRDTVFTFMVNLFDISHLKTPHTAQKNSISNGKIKHKLFEQHSYT